MSLRIIFILLPLLSNCTRMTAQTSRSHNVAQNVSQQFTKEDDKCRDLLKSKKWAEAETTCKMAARLADRLVGYGDLERMGAYEDVGHALAGQGRYEEATGYFAHALDAVRGRLNDSNAEVGQLYLLKSDG